MAFDEKKYKQEYISKHYKTFKVDLKKSEWEHIDNILKQKNMTKAEFLRLSIKALENGTLKKEETD